MCLKAYQINHCEISYEGMASERQKLADKVYKIH